MRRLLLVAAGLAALTLTVPALALASHGDRHHHRPHHKLKAHHRKVHFRHFGGHSTTSTTGSGGEAGDNTGAGGPPITPPSMTQNAGKVASYTAGVLTLTLNDGSTASGMVTTHTRIKCESATPTPAMGQDNGNGPGGDDDIGDNRQGDDNGERAHLNAAPCDTSALLPGAIVHEAELRIGPDGSQFESIELVS